MNELKIFESEEFGKVRTMRDENGNAIFGAVDIAIALGYSNPRKAVRDHCKGGTKRSLLTNGGNQEVVFIPEPDVYRLIIKSKLPSAEKFEKWVFEEILPSVRKYGGYVTPETLNNIFNNNDNLQAFLNNMLKMTEENKRLKSEVEKLETKADYFDQMMDSSFLINFRTTAKELGLRPMYFVNFLLDKKYLYRDAKKVLLPYQQQLESGYFQIKEYYKNGHKGVQTLITPIGRNHFLQLYFNGDMEQGEI